jgi:hypothetical protein
MSKILKKKIGYSVAFTLLAYLAASVAGADFNPFAWSTLIRSVFGIVVFILWNVIIFMSTEDGRD